MHCNFGLRRFILLDDEISLYLSTVLVAKSDLFVYNSINSAASKS